MEGVPLTHLLPLINDDRRIVMISSRLTRIIMPGMSLRASSPPISAAWLATTPNWQAPRGHDGGRSCRPADGGGSMIASLLSKDNRLSTHRVSRESPFKPILVSCLSCRCQRKCQGMDSERFGKCLRLRSYNGPNLRWTICQREINRPHS